MEDGRIHRQKEIGIRKVLGASMQTILSFISKDFIKMIFISFIIASSIAYYFMHKWLADFPYKIEIVWWVFLTEGVMAIGSKPIKSLRTE